MDVELAYPDIEEGELTDTSDIQIIVSDLEPGMIVPAVSSSDVDDFKEQMALFNEELNKVANTMEHLIDAIGLVSSNLKSLSDITKTHIEQASVITDMISDTSKMLAVEAVSLKTMLTQVNQIRGRFTSILFVSLCTLFFTVVVFMGLRGGI